MDHQRQQQRQQGSSLVEDQRTEFFSEPAVVPLRRSERLANAGELISTDEVESESLLLDNGLGGNEMPSTLIQDVWLSV